MRRTSTAKTNTRRPANLSIDSELLDAAKDLEVNVSRAAETGIEEAVRKARRERWLEENREALESYNEYIRKHGLPLEKYRMF
jgi:antitoxin CcdA